MNNRFKKIFLNLIIIVFFLLLPFLVFAESETSVPALDKLKSVATENGLYSDETGQDTILDAVGLIIGLAFGFLTIVFLILTIKSGINWMTASGNEETITKAKDNLKQAIIGLLIVLASWSFWEIISRVWLANI